MKRIILLVIVIATLVSCGQSIKEGTVEKDNLVPLELSDSTQWRTVQVYETKHHDLYVRENDQLYKVDTIDFGNTFGLVFLMLIIVFVIGVIIGLLER